MSDLTIAEVKKEKRKLEQAIADLAIAFTKKTGVTIDRIDASQRLESMQGVEQYIIVVEMTL